MLSRRPLSFGEPNGHHESARLTPLGPEPMVTTVLDGQTPKAIRETVGVCGCTVRNWLERFRADGLAGLQDRSSRPDPADRLTSAIPAWARAPVAKKISDDRGSERCRHPQADSSGRRNRNPGAPRSASASPFAESPAVQIRSKFNGLAAVVQLAF